MDIGFHHRGVHSHLAALHYLVLHGQLHHSPMDLFDYFRTQRQCLPSERLGVRHLTGADACEVPVDEVGAYFALQFLEGPVADMLQDHHSQDNLGWGALASARAALGMPFHQGFIN